MTDEKFKQKLYLMAPLGRWICEACNNTAHKHCEGLQCGCACRDSRPPRKDAAPRQSVRRRPGRKRKVVRDRDRLTDEERRLQAALPFDPAEAIKLKAEALRNPVTETVNQQPQEEENQNLRDSLSRELELKQ